MSQRIVIHDASILIDFHKLGLLDQLASMPHELWIPDSIWQDELLSISPEVKSRLLSRFRLGELTGDQVLQAQQIYSSDQRLSLNDCFTLILANDKRGCILLCSDRLMRTTAQGMAIEVHGVFWVFDELLQHGICEAAQLLASLLILHSDPRTRLPRDVLDLYISKYRDL